MSFKISSSTINRLKWLDTFKGIGILLVVLGHVCKDIYLHNWIYTFHMPLFFFAGGFLHKKCKLLTTIQHKIYTIIIPYFSLGFITLLYNETIAAYVNNHSLNLAVFISNLKLGIIGLFSGQYDYLDFNTPLWFLPCFFLTVCIYSLLINSLPISGTCIIVLLMTLYNLFFPLPSLPWGIESALKYISFYMFGHIFSSYNITDRLFALSYKSSITILCLIINICFTTTTFHTGILGYIFASTGVIGTLLFSHIISKYDSPLYMFGQTTLITLCIHRPIYLFILRFLDSLHYKLNIGSSWNTITSIPLFSLLVSCVTLSICYVISLILTKYTPWIIGKYQLSSNDS